MNDTKLNKHRTRAIRRSLQILRTYTYLCQSFDFYVNVIQKYELLYSLKNVTLWHRNDTSTHSKQINEEE